MADVLVVDRLVAGYGSAVVLNGVSLALEQGCGLAVLGRNGVGKTTLLCAIMGLTRIHSGAVSLNGRDISRLPVHMRAEAGIGWVPQERNIFRSLTVEENLTAVARPGPWSLRRVYDMFPRLLERKRNMGGQLSGGEQQMLAIGRALMLNPTLLLLDEPTEGLAPILVQELSATLRRIVADDGLSTIIIEQHAAKVLEITDSAIVLQRGAVVLETSSAAALADGTELEKYMGIAATG